MTKFSQLTLAAIFAALLVVIGMAPAAQAASFPTAPSARVEQAGKTAVVPAQYYRHHRGYRWGYHRPRTYYPPVYHYPRRCWTRPRVVWTPCGYVRRWIRVCR